jgi:hypothetical protein
MRVGILALFALLAISVASFANPFIGTWRADFITVVVNESMMAITVASDDPNWSPLAGTHRYIYDADVIRVGDFVAVYDISSDGSMVVVIGLLRASDNFLKVIFSRESPGQLRQESFKS